MSQVHGAGRAIKSLVGDLPVLEKKNWVLAGLLGFFFGGLGLGLYFQSWKDFIYPILVFFIVTIAWGSFIPFFGAAPGALVGFLFASCWGIWRALGSGK
jgi:hypothetical protein